MTWDEIDVKTAQKVMMSALQWFHDTCEKHELDYWLDFGTLLGAVRHGGFIPWDDDLDVSMPRSDFERFLQVAATALPAGPLFLQENRTSLIAANAKIAISGTRGISSYKDEHGLPNTYVPFALDVFVHDKAPKSRVATKLAKTAGFALATRRWAPYMVKSRGELSAGKRLRWRVQEAVPEQWAAWSTARLLEMSRNFHGSQHVYGYDCPVAPREVVPAEFILPTRLIEFEGRTFRSPNQPEPFLLNKYGSDFMTPPPPEARRTHFSHMWVAKSDPDSATGE